MILLICYVGSSKGYGQTLSLESLNLTTSQQITIKSKYPDYRVNKINKLLSNTYSANSYLNETYFNLELTPTRTVSIKLTDKVQNIEKNTSMESLFAKTSDLLTINYNKFFDCIQLYSQGLSSAEIEINGLDGKNYLRKKLSLTGDDCINIDFISSGIYIISVYNDQIVKPVVEKVIIR